MRLVGSETTLSPRARQRQVERRGWGRDRGRAVVVAVAVALAWLPSPAPLTAIGAVGANAANAANASAPAPRAADASSSGSGAGGTAAAREAMLDAVVQEVLRMLHAKVSEPVILHWLATSGQRPAAVGSREIVELQRAGASDPLMTRLLDLAARQPSPQPAPQSAAEHAAEPSTGAAAPAAAPAPPEHAASMHWRIAYHPNYGADDERWDLYVYLDGRYLAAVKAPTVSFLDPPLELDRSLAPGHHVLRVAVERHLRKLGRSGWTHAAKVAPAALAFETAPDAAGAVELRCETRLRGGPLTLRVTQGDAELARAEPTMAPPDAWPWLCEELTAGQAAGKGARLSSPTSPSSPSSLSPLGGSRSKLSSCLHWADLWPGMEAPPSRDAVRADLERRGFRSDR